MIRTKFGFHWSSTFRGEDFEKVYDVRRRRTPSDGNSSHEVLGNNSKTVNNIKNLTWDKNDQHIKIYLPCNFEVNLIIHLGVIALFSSNL
jgi:hypothetical protein